MYMYAHRQDGRKLGGQRISNITFDLMRALLEKHFPGARILSPMERKEAGDIEVITIYGSRTADGRNRCTSFYSWGIQGAYELTGHTPDEPWQANGRLLPQDEIRHMAEHTRRWTFKYLIETTTISRPEAIQMAMDAANRYAEALGIELCRCGTPVRDESNICRNCQNPIDQLLTEKRAAEHAHTCHACGKVIGTSHDCERDTDHDFGLCRRCTENATRNEGV